MRNRLHHAYEFNDSITKSLNRSIPALVTRPWSLFSTYQLTMSSVRSMVSHPSGGITWSGRSSAQSET
jgi:hypothetical protein